MNTTNTNKQTTNSTIYIGYIVGVYKGLIISLSTLGWCQSLGSTGGIATTIFRLYMPYISTSPTPIHVTIQNPQKAFFHHTRLIRHRVFQLNPADILNRNLLLFW